MSQALVARVRGFIDRHCIPIESAAHVHDPAAMDAALAQLRPLARELGLYLPQMPVQEGGLGLSWVARAAVFEEAGRSYLGPAALNCAAPDQPNMISLLRQGTAAQRERYLRPLAEGRIRSCFAMTEPAPGAGSDPSMLRTNARRDGDGWVIDGHKWFITGAVGAVFCIVLAQTDEGPTQFIVDMDNPGLHLVRAIKALDPYAVGGHGELRFTACRVGGDAVLGEVGQGLAYAQQRLEPARLSHCLRLLGRARRAMEAAQAYVCERSSFGERLADLQQVQAMVADCHIDLHASRLMSLDCARRMDEGLSVKTESAMTKVFVSEALGRIADRASQLCGALGMSEDDAPVALIVRELRPFRIYDGASELHRATLGRRFLKT
ncbi:acyl-CoA dehydrogenase family protein [Variovorax soli]|uniref:acyl-CoA dehydrogenase family protein n=1 Tax=Variovorax soli TaxID=376815 RepID=UPI00083949E7|nr:acyl-CoA dehydrogenase family protein [Variovorax soli]